MNTFWSQARENVNLTQAEVAKAMGYSTPQFVSNWERGLCEPPEKSLPKLVKLYKLKPTKVIDMILQHREKKIRKKMGLH